MSGGSLQNLLVEACKYFPFKQDIALHQQGFLHACFTWNNPVLQCSHLIRTGSINFGKGPHYRSCEKESFS